MMRTMRKIGAITKLARRTRSHGPRHVDRHATILRTAARLFAERGFEATSLDVIADELDMHKATLYHYINSKQEVLYQILVQSFGDLDEVVAAVQDKSQPVVERLRHFALALARAQNNEYGRCLAMVGTRPLEGASGQKIREFQRKLDGTVRGLLKDGVACGQLRVCDPGLVSSMLFGTLNWVPHWYRPEGRLTLNAIVNGFIDMLAYGIEADPSVGAARRAATDRTRRPPHNARPHSEPR